MNVSNIMTSNPQCCTANTSIRDAASMMLECDCGEIPVVDSSKKPLGVITDRDICCRVVAGGMNVDECTVGECMSSPALTINMNASLDECCQLMEQAQIRRIPVVDESGCCCGIVSQADLARKSTGMVEEVVERVSQPAGPSYASAR
ncbi:CBS domain-containing protein [bacterium]|nr:MAG: CBS domain-containing protein [bacterium]